MNFALEKYRWGRNFRKESLVLANRAKKRRGGCKIGGVGNHAIWAAESIYYKNSLTKIL